MTEHSTHGKISFWKLPSKEERPHKLMALFWGGWRGKKPTSSGLLIGVSGVKIGELRGPSSSVWDADAVTWLSHTHVLSHYFLVLSLPQQVLILGKVLDKLASNLHLRL